MYLFKEDNKIMETLHWDIFLRELSERCGKEINPEPLAGWYEASEEDEVSELNFS